MAIVLALWLLLAPLSPYEQDVLRATWIDSTLSIDVDRPGCLFLGGGAYPNLALENGCNVRRYTITDVFTRGGWGPIGRDVFLITPDNHEIRLRIPLYPGATCLPQVIR